MSIFFRVAFAAGFVFPSIVVNPLALAQPPLSDVNSVETVIVLNQAVPIAKLGELLGNHPSRVTTFWHESANGGDTWGGFDTGLMETEESLDAYREFAARAKAGSKRLRVFAFQVEGDLPDSARLGDLTAQRAVIPVDTTVVVRRPWMTGSGPLIIVVGPTSGAFDAGLSSTAAREISPELSPGPKEVWSPEGGTIQAQDLAGAKVIDNSFIWDASALAELAGWAYEHDVKLYKPHAGPFPTGDPADPQEISEIPDDALEGNQRPFCGLWTQNDFWAVRDGWIWSWNYPDEAGPYVDTDWLDPCYMMDFTIGLMFPGPDTLVAGQGYFHQFITTGASHVSESVFSLGFQRNSKEQCDLPDQILPGSDVFCIGVGEDLTGEGSQVMFPESDGLTMPTCIQWFNFSTPGWGYCAS